jgi:hypothetical protein
VILLDFRGGYGPAGARLSQDQFAARGAMSQRLLKKKTAEASRASQERKQLYKENVVAKKAKKPEPKEEVEEVEEERPEIAFQPQKTDFGSLFGTPTPSSEQVIPLEVKSAPPRNASFEQVLLDRLSGNYARFLPQAVTSVYGETMKKVGPVGYATLMLAKAPTANLKQKKRALTIVNKLAGSTQNASQRVAAP